jgi:hypothetical protein
MEHAPLSLPNIIGEIKARKIRWDSQHTWEAVRNTYKIIVEKPQQMGTHKVSTQRLEDDVKISLREIGCQYVDRHSPPSSAEVKE